MKRKSTKTEDVQFETILRFIRPDNIPNGSIVSNIVCQNVDEGNGKRPPPTASVIWFAKYGVNGIELTVYVHNP